MSFSWLYFIVLLLAFVALFWFYSLRAREIALGAARQACRIEGVQLLDDTIFCHRSGLVRTQSGRLAWRRAYLFEYSVDGLSRTAGALSVIDGQPVAVQLQTLPGEIIAPAAPHREDGG